MMMMTIITTTIIITTITTISCLPYHLNTKEIQLETLWNEIPFLSL